MRLACQGGSGVAVARPKSWSRCAAPRRCSRTEAQTAGGCAPQALAGLERPDAIFIGGGVTRDGVLDTCWTALKPGGRLIANAVTLQSEMTLMAWRELHGGELTRIHIAQAQPLGEFDTWRQALPITLLDVTKPLDA